MMFEVGDKVVCVDASAPEDVSAAELEKYGGMPLKQGQVYTVAGYCDWPAHPLSRYPRNRVAKRHLVLEEVKNLSAEPFGLDGFAPSRFRKLPKLDTSAGLAALKALTQSPPAENPPQPVSGILQAADTPARVPAGRGGRGV